jgi:hypothetical protein
VHEWFVHCKAFDMPRAVKQELDAHFAVLRAARARVEAANANASQAKPVPSPPMLRPLGVVPFAQRWRDVVSLAERQRGVVPFAERWRGVVPLAERQRRTAEVLMGGSFVRYMREQRRLFGSYVRFARPGRSRMRARRPRRAACAAASRTRRRRRRQAEPEPPGVAAGGAR